MLALLTITAAPITAGVFIRESTLRYEIPKLPFHKSTEKMKKSKSVLSLREDLSSAAAVEALFMPIEQQITFASDSGSKLEFENTILKEQLFLAHEREDELKKQIARLEKDKQQLEEDKNTFRVLLEREQQMKRGDSGSLYKVVDEDSSDYYECVPNKSTAGDEREEYLPNQPLKLGMQL